MSDLVERLRKKHDAGGFEFVKEAADEIERLRIEYEERHAENTEDAIRHGRIRKSKGKPRRKLTREKVEILLNPPNGKTLRELSQEFGITYRHAKKIRQGISWSVSK